MIIAGYIISGLGIAIYAVGVGYWFWFIFRKSRFRIPRRPNPWDSLGCFTVLGLLLVAAGQALVMTGRRLGR